VLKINDHRLTDIKLRIMKKLNMVNLGFSYNETTYNSKITLIEKIDLEKVNLKIDFLKSFDDEDYYEFEDFENYEINNLNFKLTDGDMYEVTFDVKVTTSYDNWKNADENFKKNAIEGRLEVEFSLEDEDKLFFNGEDFQKEYDGLTKLILNED
tara:strand:+ start:52 stop:513 length:462 start_codon:yes stop_codon:yes gene_type:complete